MQALLRCGGLEVAQERQERPLLQLGDLLSQAVESPAFVR